LIAIGGTPIKTAKKNIIINSCRSFSNDDSDGGLFSELRYMPLLI
jgi:hypothetical protein